MIPTWVFDYGWYGWIAYFAVLEGLALIHGGTFSAHAWHWFGYDTTGLKDKSAWARFRRFAGLAFLVWLIVHIVGGGRLM